MSATAQSIEDVTVNARRRRGDPGTGFALFKRSLDIVGAVVGLVILSPLLVGCGAWIKLVHGGPVLYHQWRVGHDGWLFKIYKLRTMSVDAETADGARFATADDCRILRGCVWMRKSHADELPQLWNIVVGQMSLVGPRPERPEMFEQLRPTMPRIERRLAVRPGLTGLAQVVNGYTNDSVGARRKLAYDLRYLRKLSILTEIRLLLATIPKIWDRASM